MTTLNIDTMNALTEMCEIGAIHGTDKSPQSKTTHRHAFTPIYDLLFSPYKHKHINIAEIGTHLGGGLKMFYDYFENATIHGYDIDISQTKEHLETEHYDRITLSEIDVSDESSLKNTFKHCDIQYDIIIEDSTHKFKDQIRVISCCFEYLKTGGAMIIEDIFKGPITIRDYRYYPEECYYKALEEEGIMNQIASMTFLNLTHDNSYTGEWNNDKLLVIVK